LVDCCGPRIGVHVAGDAEIADFEAPHLVHEEIGRLYGLCVCARVKRDLIICQKRLEG
jgi:hypothetical protein